MKRILSFVLAAVLLLSCIPVTASATTSGTCGDNATWTYDASTGTLTVKGTGAMYDYVVDSPEWDSKSITQVVIDSGITHIGENAFALCTGLLSITIPSSVSSIGSAAFQYCSKLAHVYISDLKAWLTMEIADQIADPLAAHPQPKSLYLNNRLITNLTIPKEITEIRDFAFYKCVSLEYAAVPEGVTGIGTSAFEHCEKMTGISLPNTLISIGNSAFDCCKSLTDIEIPEGVTVIGENTFNACENLVTVTTGPNVTSIGEAAFYECGSLTDFTIPKKVTTIGQHAFNGCKKLTGIVIPEGVTEIAQSAFHSCYGLSEITIPSKVTSIGRYAFYWCSNLKRVTLPRSLTTVGDDAFDWCDKLSNVYYHGTETQRETITFGEGNYRLTSAQWNYIPCKHSFSDWAYTTEPTCTESGEEARACSLCGETETREAEALDHDYGNWTAVVDPTCTEDGIEMGTCGNCGDTTSRRKRATGHSCDQWTTTKAPTCTEEGEQAGFCTVCRNDVKRSVPEMGHDHTAVVTVPTCTGGGYTTYTCDCGDTYIDDKVAAAGHSWSKWTVSREPTFQEKGEQTRTCGTCGETETKSVNILKLSAPAVKITGNSATGKPVLNWNAVQGAAKYQIYRATSKSGEYALLKTVTGISYTNTSAKVGKIYYYKVRAVAEDGTKSDYSDIVSRTCDLPRPNVKVSNVASSGKIKLSWSKIEGAKKYQIYRSTSKNGEYTLLKTVTGTSYTNTSAKAGKLYYYKVRAIHSNSSANSAYSEVDSRRCDLARPSVTIKLKNGDPRLTWEKISGAAKYQIYRATSKNGKYTLMKTTTGTSYTNTSAKAGKTYYYKVRAIHSNSSANSAYSSIKSIKAK